MRWVRGVRGIALGAVVVVVVLVGTLVVPDLLSDDDSGDADAGGDAASAGAGEGTSGEVVTIGVALPDIEAFAALSDQFDVGDLEEQMDAVLESWRRDGVVPLHGRDVEFVYRKFSIMGTDEQIAACNGFVKDDDVFMVIGMRSFEAGAECLATRFRVPTVSLGTFVSDEDFAQRHPYHLTVRTSMSRLARNLVHWADGRGLLEGRTIGLYSTDDAVTEDMVGNLESELAGLGMELATRVETDTTLAGPQDGVAVQRFRQEGVDLAILLVGVIPSANFMLEAEQQDYRPEYVATDYQDHTADASSSNFSEEQYAGTLAMTQTRSGQIHGEGGLTETAEGCVSSYEDVSGADVERTSPESAELGSILQACDLGAVARVGLEGAGPDLDPTALIEAVEGIDGLEMAAHGDVSFDPQRHHGVDEFRTIQWQRHCSCWSAIEDFAPFPVS